MNISPFAIAIFLFAPCALEAAVSANVCAVPICLGDGTGPSCPCGNNGQPGAGCANSLGFGATLSGVNFSGTAVVAADISSADPVHLNVTGLPPGSPHIFFQGSPIGFTLFGDGMRCVGNPFQIKLGIKIATAGGTSTYPQAGDNPLALQSYLNTALIPPTSRSYQVWYRNAPVFCTPFTFNFSNAVEMPWN